MIDKSPTSLTATAPAHTAGAVNVYVLTAGGTSPVSSAATYTFTPATARTATSTSHAAKRPPPAAGQRALSQR